MVNGPNASLDHPRVDRWPPAILERRKRLREVASNHGVDLRTAALQFSAAPDTAAATVVGASSKQQILADCTSTKPRSLPSFGLN